MNAFGKLLRAFRTDHEMSLRDMASSIKSTATTIKKVEDGGMPSLPTFASLVKVLNCDVGKALKDVMRGRNHG